MPKSKLGECPVFYTTVILGLFENLKDRTNVLELNFTNQTEF